MQIKTNLEASWNPIKRGRNTYIIAVSIVNKCNLFRLSTKFTCNSSSIGRPKSCRLQAKFVPGYTTDTLIRRQSTIRTKHESTARKGTKYTLNKNKLTCQSVFVQPRLTSAVQQHGRTVVAKNAGSVYSSRALPARVSVRCVRISCR